VTEPGQGSSPPEPWGGGWRLDLLLRRRPVITWSATALIVGTSLMAFALPDQVLALRLAKVNQRILAGEWWRLLTVALVHGSLLHLFFNAYALYNLGGLVERLYGRARYLVLLVVGTAAATAASVAWTPAPAVGASGGIFALVGALLVLGLSRRSALPEPVRRRLLRDMAWIAALNLALGATIPYVDNAAHVGGLVAGLALGGLLGPAAEVRRLSQRGFPPGGATR
jgi:rhomboid protease GluP